MIEPNMNNLLKCCFNHVFVLEIASSSKIEFSFMFNALLFFHLPFSLSQTPIQAARIIWLRQAEKGE